jgi:putative oxidoreductase
MDTHTQDRMRTITLTALRVVAGAAFFVHGAQKLFGWFGGFGPDGGTAPLASQFGAAGVIETVGSLCIILGLFTRPVAFLLSGEMAVAYFMVHVGGSGQLWWWDNRGEVVMLFSFTWLFFSAWGAGPVSLDARIRERRIARDDLRDPASPRSVERESPDVLESSTRRERRREAVLR